MMRGRPLPYVMLFGWFVCLSLSLGASPDDVVFRALSTGEIDPAMEMVGGLPNDAAHATAREGAALAAWSQLRWDVAAPLWYDALHGDGSPLRLAALLELFRRAQDEVAPPLDWRERLERLAAVDDAATARLLNERRYDDAVARGAWDEARMLLTPLGQIGQWRFVVGGFARHGRLDDQTPFPPERDLGAARYAGAVGTVRWQTPPYSPTGRLSVEGLVDPPHGWSYALTVIETNEQGAAWLELHTPADLTVWWNGRALLRASGYRLNVAQRHRVEVALVPGRHWLLVKQRASPRDQLLARLYREDGRAVVFDTPRVTLEDVAGLSVRPDAPAMFDVAPDAPPVPGTPREWIDVLYRALEAGAREAFALELACLDALRRATPDAPLPRLLLAEQYLQMAERRPASAERLRRQALGEVEAVLKRQPANRWALLLGARERMRLEQPRQALADIEQALGVALGRLGDHEAYLAPGLLLAGARACQALDYEADALLALHTALRYHPSAVAPRRALARILEARHAGGDAARAWHALALRWGGDADDLEHAARAQAAMGDLDAALGLTRQGLTGHPNHLGLQRTLADLLMRAERPDEALSSALEVAVAYPDHPGAQRQLMEIALACQDHDTALHAAQRLLDLRPADREAERVMGALGQAPPDFAAPHDVTLDQLDRAPVEAWRESRAAVVYLIDVMVERIEANHAYQRYTHLAIELLNRDGLERHGELSLPAGAEIRFVRTVQPDGGVQVPERIHEGATGPVVSLYGLRVGSIIEYAYVERGPGMVDGPDREHLTGFTFGALSDPMLLSRLVIDAPREMPLRYSHRPLDFVPTRTVQGERVVLRWERRNVDGLKPEPNTPPLSELAATVRLTTTPDWSGEGAFVAGWFAERAEDDPAHAEAMAAINLAHTDTPEARARAVFRHVRHHWSDSPGGQTDLDALLDGAGSVLARQAGLERLLDLANVRRHAALLYEIDPDGGHPLLPTRSLPRRPLTRVGGPLGVEPLPLFGVAADGPHPGAYLDLTTRHIDFGALPGGMADRPVLLVAQQGLLWEPATAAAWPGSWSRLHLHAQLETGGDARVRARLGFEGHGPRSLRQNLADPQVARQFTQQQVVATGMRGVVTLRAELLGVDDPDAPLFLDLEGRWPSAARIVDNGLALAPVTTPLQLASLAREATREHPLDPRERAVPAPFVATYELPRDSTLTWDWLPEDTIVIDRAMVYALTFRRDGRRVTVARSVLTRPGLIAPRDYPRFAELCRRIDAAEQTELIAREFQTQLEQ